MSEIITSARSPQAANSAPEQRTHTIASFGFQFSGKLISTKMPLLPSYLLELRRLPRILFLFRERLDPSLDCSLRKGNSQSVAAQFSRALAADLRSGIKGEVLDKVELHRQKGFLYKINMKTLIFGLLLSAATLGATDVSGRWSGKVEFRYEGRVTSSEPAYAILRHEGNELSGGAGPKESDQQPIQNGSVQGDAVRFEMSHGGQTMVFDLRIQGERLEGSVREPGDPGSVQTMWMSLKRVVTK